MTTQNSETIEQLRDRIAELEKENEALNARLADIRRRSVPLPDPGQLSPQQYRAITSELVQSGIFSEVNGKLIPCWCSLPSDGSISESVRRRHYDCFRQFVDR